jgi:signal transduction histidine kinase
VRQSYADPRVTEPGLSHAPAPHAHAVQFYEDDHFLYGAVADYLSDGLAAGEGAIVIAVEAHREGFLAALAERGVDAPRLRREGRLALLDARETLAAFMVGGMPSAEHFHAAIAPLLEHAARGRSGARPCAYGEMVDLLWKEGNRAAAIRLEALWNELSEQYGFSLLCAYAIHNFADAAHADQFLEICRLHGHVVPTERYTAVDDAAGRAVEISRLQQRAEALEAEIARRRSLEEQLREALAGQARLLELEREAREAAELASRAKSSFLAVMSHELRTPLNAIGGYTELLEMGVHGPVSEPQRATLEQIRRSQRRLLGLIEDVLTHAVEESGTLRYHISQVPMDEVLRTADLCINPQMAVKGVRYAYSACEPGIVALADREKLQQIVLNLLANATKFTPAGGSVELDCDASGDRVQVRVRDTGIGIAADQQEAIFQPFVQVDTGLVRRYEGVGLGLSISREFAREMGGDLTVSSAPGRGSTFILTLPRA